jgi:hypothetical protein
MPSVAEREVSISNGVPAWSPIESSKEFRRLVIGRSWRPTEGRLLVIDADIPVPRGRGGNGTQGVCRKTWQSCLVDSGRASRLGFRPTL